MNVTHNQMQEAIDNTITRMLQNPTAVDTISGLRFLAEELSNIADSKCEIETLGPRPSCNMPICKH